MKRHLLVPVALGLAACSGQPYYQMPPQQAYDRVNFYVRQVMANRPLPGIAVAIVRDTTVMVDDGFGQRRLGDTTAPVGSETAFHAGAVARAFTAVAILRLVAEGRIELDSPVTRYLPYFQLADGRQNEVTARVLMSHSSGLPDVPSVGRELGPADAGSLERYTRGLSDQRLTVDTVGAVYHFSAAGYSVLGDLLAKAGGAPYESVLTRAVLRPLGLTHTRSSAPAAGGVASGHRGVLRPEAAETPVVHPALVPSMGLWSTIADLARFTRALTGGGFLPDSLRDLLWQTHVSVDADVQMGLGWTVRQHGRNRVAMVESATPGYAAIVAVVPEHHVGLAVLANHDPQTSREMIELVHGLLDVGQGQQGKAPSVSIAVPLAQVYARRNVNAVAGTFQGLHNSSEQDYAIEPDAIIGLGDEVRRLGRAVDAIRIYQLNTEAHREYYATYRALALTYLDLADTLNAAENYRTMLQLEPERQGCPAACYRDPRLELILRTR